MVTFRDMVWVCVITFYTLVIAALGVSIGDEIYWSQAPLQEKLGMVVGFAGVPVFVSLLVAGIAYFFSRKITVSLFVYFGAITFINMLLFYGLAR